MSSHEPPEHASVEHEQPDTGARLEPAAPVEPGTESSWPRGEPPYEPAARGPRAGAATIAITATLVASLAGNALLGTQVRDQRDEIARLEATVARQEQELEDLRQGLREGDDGDDVLERIASAVERLRGLRFRSSVRTEVLAPAAFRARVRREIQAETDTAELRAAQKVLVMLGVIPANYDLADELLAIQEEQVGGFYDNKRKRLVVPAADAKDPSPLEREVLAHEYVHALTDQHFDLSRLDRLQDDDRDDEGLAYVALAEGDAEAVRELYENQVLTDADRRRLLDEAAAIPIERFAAAPRFLQEVFLFPYREGPRFVAALREQGGFERVNQAYRDPPRSTEQILHPARYLDDRDDPRDVTMPDLARALGSGWRRIDEGQVGEFDVRLIASYGGQGIAFREARAAADGWDGGRYAAYESGSRVVVAIRTVWDSEAEAREALRLLGKWLPLRFRNVGESYDVGANGTGWAGRNGAGAIVRDGTSLVLVLGTARDDVERARRALS